MPIKMLFRDKFKTNSNRFQNWDYSSEAVYFITIVTKNRMSIFGSIEEEKMILNENGKTIEKELLKSIKICKNWFFHNWGIMPNHIRLLIEIQDTLHIVETHCIASLQNQPESKFSRKSNSISSFVGTFKSITTKQINGVESIWQANYHDHIVRNYKTFEKIYDYIKHNPISWETDSLK